MNTGASSHINLLTAAQFFPARQPRSSSPSPLGSREAARMVPVRLKGTQAIVVSRKLAALRGCDTDCDGEKPTRLPNAVVPFYSILLYSSI
jgi:hypothetical protein